LALSFVILGVMSSHSLSLCFRLPGRIAPLGHWLAWLFPEADRATRRRWVEDGWVTMDGHLADRLGIECPAGARIEIRGERGDFSSTLVTPVSPLGSRAGSPDEGPSSDWIGLIDDPPWRSGALRSEGKPEIEFEIGERRQGLAVVTLTGPACERRMICDLLAGAGMPLVGDLCGGGLAVVGGLRLFAGESADASRLDWPEEPAWCGLSLGDFADPEASTPILRVSDETARVIRKGHPWILPDRSSDPVTRFRPGTLLRIVSREGQPLAWAHAEGDPRLSARIWAVGVGEAREAASVEARVARALARRRDLLRPREASDLEPGKHRHTNAFRLIHGEGDDLPGLYVDRLGPLLRVLVTGRAAETYRASVIAALGAQLPLTPEGEDWNILELLHLRSPGGSQFDRVRWLAGGLEKLATQNVGVDAVGFHVFERGLEFGVDPGWATPRGVRPGYGLFVDQRENRARLEQYAARGGAWLNLFAHTGAFSVSLLANGARRVTSVDLSASYLGRLDENLSLNRDRGVDSARHDSVRTDGRRFLEKLDTGQRFSGIVLDPPTAAAAGRRFWSLQKDLEPLIRNCVARLDGGGCLLVTQNRNGPPLGLERVLERAAARSHRGIARLEAAPAGQDHPTRLEFPDGDPFEGWLLELD
jgi:23S rRNA (cytosine1962-C5)-methyltransferase